MSVHPHSGVRRYHEVDKPCTVPGCTRQRDTHSKYCPTHYGRLQRTGNLERTVNPVNLRDYCPIGRNILALRIREGISAESLAKRVGVTAWAIGAISRGGGSSLDTLRAIAAAFDVEVWELLKPNNFPLPENLRERANHARV